MDRLEQLRQVVNDRLKRLQEILSAESDRDREMAAGQIPRWFTATCAALAGRVDDGIVDRLQEIADHYAGWSALSEAGSDGYLYLKGVLGDLDSDPAAVVSGITFSKEGLFLPGQEFDAWTNLRSIFGSARVSVDIIDGYIGQDVLTLLTEKGSGVEVRILTGAQKPTRWAVFVTHATRFTAQHGGLRVRRSTDFHDRSVILDSTECYHFGASLEHVGKRAFMFSRIEEPKVLDLLRGAIEDAWNRAEVVI